MDKSTKKLRAKVNKSDSVNENNQNLLQIGVNLDNSEDEKDDIQSKLRVLV